ncbi:peptidoglycan editing factor PgeF [Planococcus sp. NCCP-2050]|uniref:peptidoglycan editing factor PgeF n=1 Tax=Planococcus sp. NCCP-2050 TaxID=2944679 RepID=UPI00204171F6|nr:peptidoglycan editing factor PgeF [Planococcus sp. NCCP-2050]GKW46104.1 laccase domain protein YlmD [Planococcus sp. NCCP-2050]
MKKKLYVDNEKFIAGMTFKDPAEAEQNNMALHVCENPASIVENRRKLAAELGRPLTDFVAAEQTHSANFHRVIAQDRGRGAETKDTAIKNTDALYTFEPNLILSSFAADCVPVLFYNGVSGVVGAIHSGWQGTVKEISLKLFEHLKQQEQCDPTDFHVQIGAALSQQKFEVDEDVFLKFKDLGYADEFISFNAETKKYHIDNQLTVQKQCELAGIPASQITIDRTCTFQDPSGFSYRQDKKSGRHMGFIMKKEV